MGKFSRVGRNAILIVLAITFFIEATTSANISTKYVIIDTDMGPDDTWAVMMLLRASDLIPHIKVVGITCTHGNTKVENVARNARRILALAGRCDVPVIMGTSESIRTTPAVPTWFGNDGMCDLTPSEDAAFGPLCPEYKGNAVEAINSYASKYPRGVTLLCLAPLTNIALAMKIYRDLRIERLIIMGGNAYNQPNPEFNFGVDPEAASIVLEKGKPLITVVPFETTDQPDLNLTLEWRFDVLGNQQNSFVQFMNLVEGKLYPKSSAPWRTFSLVAAVFLFPQTIASYADVHATVELADPNNRGKLLVDTSIEPNVRLIQSLDPDEIKKTLLWTANATQVLSYPQYKKPQQVY